MASAKTDCSQKHKKKLNKLSQKLLRKEKIQISNEASSILCICNGGLDNGVSQEEMSQVFRVFCNHIDVIMIPQKSYCFVCFQSTIDAERCCTELNGYILPTSEHRKTEVILYMFYVKEAPCSISPTNDRPPGLILLEDFITEEYADRIMDSINWDDSAEPAQVRALRHRRVKHYGYEFKYSINKVDPDEPLVEGVPDVYKPMLEKLIDLGHVKHYPDQLTINQYQPGQGIPPHIDTPSAFEDGLVSLSLGSQVLMEFRHKHGQHLSVLLPERSVLIMTGESRYEWSHGITPRKSDIVTTPDGSLTLAHRGVRTSFTFRKITGVRPEELWSPSIPKTDETAEELEKLHVHKVYEEIAGHFSGTRHTPWPKITEFLKKWPPGSLLADFGCGNGKYFGINKQIFEIGSDHSFNLAKICHERNFQVFVGDVLSIPLRENIFDVCLCIAVIHHLSTKERRRSATCELMKILRPGGQALIYVWALEQELNKVKSKYLKQNSNDENNSDTDVNNLIDKETDELKKELITSCTDSAKLGNINLLGRNKNNCDKVTDIDRSDTHVDSNTPNSSLHVDSVTLNGSMLTTKLGDSGVPVSKENNLISQCLKDASVHPSYCDKPTDEDERDVYTDSFITNDSMLTSPSKLEVHVNRTKFKQQDVLVPWQLKSKDKQTTSGNTYHRYYHVFQKGEIEMLCKSVENCKVVTSYYDQGNWAVILEKLQNGSC